MKNSKVFGKKFLVLISGFTQIHEQIPFPQLTAPLCVETLQLVCYEMGSAALFSQCFSPAGARAVPHNWRELWEGTAGVCHRSDVQQNCANCRGQRSLHSSHQCSSERLQGQPDVDKQSHLSSLQLFFIFQSLTVFPKCLDQNSHSMFVSSAAVHG